jgi:hypothetical protein
VRFRRNHDPQPSEAEVYRSLRQQVLRLTAEQLGDAAADEPMLALLMESVYATAVATLVAVVDGSTSMYFSNGGGIIGAGAHASVAEASRRWVEAGREILSRLSETTDPPPPAESMTQFVAVAPDGVRAALAPEIELQKSDHPLSPLFYAGHDVITQMRLAERAV